MLPLLLISLVLAQSNKHCVGDTFCVHGTVSGTSVTYTVFSKASGWASLAYAPKGGMTGTTTYTGWLNSSQGYMLQAGFSTKQELPAYKPEIIAKLVPVTIPKPAWAKLAFSFTRPVTDAGTTIKSGTVYGWAHSDSPPSEIDKISSSYSKHTAVGAFSTDFTCADSSCGSGARPFLDLPPNYSIESIRLIHGIFMFIAWFICPIVAIYIARYMKHIGHKWYQFHLILFIFGTMMFSAIGLFFIFAYKIFIFPTSIHGLLGVAISVLLLVQVILGFVINSLYDSKRTNVPWHDMLHKYLGRFLTLIAFGNIGFGLYLLPSSYRLYLYVYCGLVAVVLLFYGYKMYSTPAETRQKEKSKKKKSKKSKPRV